MNKKEFPLILSPNLGCPKIIPENEIENGIEIIIAVQYGEHKDITKEMLDGAFKLVPSFSEDKLEDIDLEIVFKEELTGWNRLFDFSKTHDTQLLINSEIHYNVLGENTRYWLIRTIPSKKKDLLKSHNNKRLPTLYNLVFTEKSDKKPIFKKINYHAVQFVETFIEGLNFIHLTDLHIAQRNDEILDEVLKIEPKDENGLIDRISSFFSKKKKDKVRSREEIINSYKNFNNNFRKFIHEANKKAQKGELDFVVITGDIVDFAGPGWDEEIGVSENSWKIFIDIVTGKGNEDKMDFMMNNHGKILHNPGLNIAIFTTPGNHDYRMHPGGLLPYAGEGQCKIFGLNEVEAKNYNYKSFDSSEYPKDERKKMSDAIVSESLNALNLTTLKDKLNINGTKYFEKNWWLQYILGILGVIGYNIDTVNITDTDFLNNLKGYEYKGIPIIYLVSGLFLILSAIGFIVQLYLKTKVKKAADFIVDNPSHAEVKALHYYFKHINPYFDYAFSYGKNHFILMDTGVDAITVGVKELMDGKELKYLKNISVMDNAIGMSPDSMAFDDRQAFYNWSQIVWLDKVLTGISNNKCEDKENIFIGVHAPPLNFDYEYRTNLKALSEGLKKPDEVNDNKVIPKYVKENELKFLDLIFEILRKRKLMKYDKYIFAWNDIPEKTKQFFNFMKKEYNIDWVKSAKIDIINNEAIGISDGTNNLLMQLNDKKTEVELTINNIRTDVFKVKPDGKELKIYKNELDKLNLTYGTINHYLSQFFFLCSGHRENPKRRIDPDKEMELKKVDLVLSGHAHIEVEFRLEVKKEDKEDKVKVRIYHDEYSKKYPDTFYDSNTFIVQTAACGPQGEDSDSPPYWRMVKVNEKNRITSFKQDHL